MIVLRPEYLCFKYATYVPKAAISWNEDCSRMGGDG